MTDFADKVRLEGCKAVGSTDKGLWIQGPDFDEDVFVPQSQIDDESEVWKEGQEGELVVSAWFAGRRGWV